MKVILKRHAYKRLTEPRQKGINAYDVIEAASNFIGEGIIAKTGFKVKNNIAKSGKIFDMVIADEGKDRIIITIIGQ